MIHLTFLPWRGYDLALLIAGDMEPSCVENSSSADGPDEDVFEDRWIRRLVGLVVAGVCVAVIVVAALRVEVYGQTCGMVTRTGLPCPTCGMTTAFRAAVRGDLVGGFSAQPFGPVLCLMTAVLAVAGLAQMVTGWRVFAWLCPHKWIGPGALINLHYWPLLLGVLGTMAGWFLKIFLHYLAGELPLG